MLQIDGKQRRLGALHLGHEDVTGRDQALLVGKRGERALPHGLERRFEPRRADDGRHDPVGRPAGGFEQGVLPCPDLDVGAGQAFAQSGVASWVGNHGQLSAMQDGELGETSDVLAAGEGGRVTAAGGISIASGRPRVCAITSSCSPRRSS